MMAAATNASRMSKDDVRLAIVGQWWGEDPAAEVGGKDRRRAFKNCSKEMMLHGGEAVGVLLKKQFQAGKERQLGYSW